MFLLFLVLGSFGGFLSGLLGVGGAIIMIPLMLIVPPVFGFPELSMQTISGLSIMQVFFSSISGMIRHHRNRTVNRTALLLIGITMAAGSILGVYLSKIVPGSTLLLGFGLLAATALFLMLLNPGPEDGTANSDAVVNSPLSLLIGTSVGTLSGMVGAGGGFILIPLMIHVLRIPTRTAIGTSLGIVFIGSITGAVGKAVTGQVDWLPAAALVIGAVVFAQWGACVSKRIPAGVLRVLLILVILSTNIQVWWHILA